MSTFKKVIQDIGFVSVSKILISVEGIVLLSVLTKFLGAQGFGVWSQVKITLALLVPIASLGLNRTIGRFLTGIKDKKHFGREWTATVISGAVFATALAAGLALVSGPLSRALTGLSDTQTLFLLASPLLLLRVIDGFSRAVFRARQKFSYWSGLMVLIGLLDIVLIYAFLKRGLGVQGVIYAFLLSAAMSMAIAVYINRGWLFSAKPNFEKLGPKLSYGISLMFIPLLQWVFQVGDQYLLGWFYGAAVVGVYAFAYSVAYVIKTLSQSVTVVLYHQLISLWNQEKYEAFDTQFRIAYKVMMYLLIPAAAGISILSKEIVLLLASKEFLEAATIVPILVAGITIFVFWSFASILLEVHNKPEVLRNVFFLYMVMNVVLNLLLIPVIGMLGAAIATLATFIMSFIYSCYILRKYGQPLMPRYLVKLVTAAGAMAWAGSAALDAMQLHTLTETIIIMACGAVLYVLLTVLLRAVTASEIANFLSTLKKEKS